ncbi:hypothetical protein FB45DRAFT_1068268 [Roridomyces roridus]|uniref:AB hydrolase-1 domain-containing protein n=1 Tax=Roridomyces roridus TaxID=1738132 RepID=A0AAD7B121_9AGAR|nr:hypothetical protein FB45DRAFT_1068268 [Roridomyces roridus]
MLSQTLLDPLQAKSVQFAYCHDRPLQCVATRYTLEACDPEGFTFIFASGISLCQDTWLPVIKQLFRLSSESFRVHSAWVVERPNHGEAALLNAAALKEHYSVQFPSLQYASAIHAFLTSNILSASERKNLVGAGHSGGGGSLIQAVQYGLRDGHAIPLKSLFLVEAPIVGPEVWPYLALMYDGVKRSNARRTSSWPSKQVAMKWFQTHTPWKSFSPDVLCIVEDTYFMPDPGRPGFITTKTTVEQETACFVDNGTQLLAGPFLRTILDQLPTHTIEGTLQDIWPPAVYDLIAVNRAEARDQLASIAFVNDVGHYLPVVKPHQVATRIFEMLRPPLVPSKL